MYLHQTFTWWHCLKLTKFWLQPYRQYQQKGTGTRGQSRWCLRRWRHITQMVSTQMGALTEWHAQKLVSLMAILIEETLMVVGGMKEVYRFWINFARVTSMAASHFHSGSIPTLTVWDIRKVGYVLVSCNMGHIRQSFSSSCSGPILFYLIEESLNSLAYACGLNESCKSNQNWELWQIRAL